MRLFVNDESILSDLVDLLQVLREGDRDVVELIGEPARKIPFGINLIKIGFLGIFQVRRSLVAERCVGRAADDEDVFNHTGLDHLERGEEVGTGLTALHLGEEDGERLVFELLDDLGRGVTLFVVERHDKSSLNGSKEVRPNSQSGARVVWV